MTEAPQGEPAPEPIEDIAQRRIDTNFDTRRFSSAARTAVITAIADGYNTTTLEGLTGLLKREDEKGVPDGKRPLAELFQGQGEYTKEPDPHQLLDMRVAATRLLAERRIPPNDPDAWTGVTSAGIILREELTRKKVSVINSPFL